MLYEFVTVLGASDQTIARTSTLEGGVWFPSEALYAIASRTPLHDRHMTVTCPSHNRSLPKRSMPPLPVRRHRVWALNLTAGRLHAAART